MLTTQICQIYKYNKNDGQHRIEYLRFLLIFWDKLILALLNAFEWTPPRFTSKHMNKFTWIFISIEWFFDCHVWNYNWFIDCISFEKMRCFQWGRIKKMSWPFSRENVMRFKYIWNRMRFPPLKFFVKKN